MLKLLRIIAIIICAIFICLAGVVYAIVRLRNPNCVGDVARMFSSMRHLLGINLIRRTKAPLDTPAIYIANHQNNYDMVTISSMVTGNILINREKRTSAIGTMTKVGEIIKERQVSIWMFPEGTRSRGRGLLPFKTGAFHTAIAAGVPIVPIVCSTLHNKIDLNRLNNGTVICETLEPIDTSGYSRENIKELIEKCHAIMQAKIEALDKEVAELESKA